MKLRIEHPWSAGEASGCSTKLMKLRIEAATNLTSFELQALSAGLDGPSRKLRRQNLSDKEKSSSIKFYGSERKQRRPGMYKVALEVKTAHSRLLIISLS